MAVFREGILLLPILLAAVVLFPSSTSSEIWAVLVATSNGFYNYAFEAAIYKAYHVLRAGGVPRENIIVFSTDVIAYNPNNPNMGTVFYATDVVSDLSEEVYIGPENIDYAGFHNNTGPNFLAVLRGDKKAIKSGSGRVLDTDPEDTVLIYYVGYGTTGALSFPGYYDYVFADDFVPLLEDLLADKYFRKALIVVDATNAGSNFDDYITTGCKMVAVTSTGRTDYSRLYMREENLGQFTVPYFSYNWLHSVQKAQYKKTDDYKDDTILAQFSHTKNVPYGEKFGIYGNLEAALRFKITEFFGSQSDVDDRTERMFSKFQNYRPEVVKFEFDDEITAGKHVQPLVRSFINKTISNIFEKSINQASINEDRIEADDFILPMEKFKCYKNLISSFHRIFPDIQDKYLVEVHFPKLAKLCSLNIPEEKVVDIMEKEYNQNRHLLIALK